MPDVNNDAHLWAAVRYVERYPVRANIVSRAEAYPWSSAAAHCGLVEASVRPGSTDWDAAFAGISDWAAWLQATDEADTMQRLRRHAQKNLPCSSEGFIDRLERIAGRPLRARSAGRPRNRQCPDSGSG